MTRPQLCWKLVKRSSHRSRGSWFWGGGGAIFKLLVSCLYFADRCKAAVCDTRTFDKLWRVLPDNPRPSRHLLVMQRLPDWKLKCCACQWWTWARMFTKKRGKSVRSHVLCLWNRVYILKWNRISYAKASLIREVIDRSGALDLEMMAAHWWFWKVHIPTIKCRVVCFIFVIVWPKGGKNICNMYLSKHMDTCVT